MIDISKLQLFDVAPELGALMATNNNLKKVNKILRCSLVILSIGGIVFCSSQRIYYKNNFVFKSKELPPEVKE